jgi:hypothetical protein
MIHKGRTFLLRTGIGILTPASGIYREKEQELVKFIFKAKRRQAARIWSQLEPDPQSWDSSARLLEFLEKSFSSAQLGFC